MYIYVYLYSWKGYVMSKFYGKLCPVCRVRFEEGDDIVVCPDCGTPHHRACYMITEKCALSQLHNDGFTWNGALPDEQSGAESNEESSKENISADFSQESADPHHAEYPNAQAYDEPSENPFGAQNEGHDGAPFTNPYAEAYKQIQQMTSDETRGEDGVSAKELSRFVGTSVLHYAQAFSAFRTGVVGYGGTKRVKAFLNVWAGILSPIQQIYRRMDGLGIILLIIQAVIALPEVLLLRYSGNLTQSAMSTLQTLSAVSSIVSIALLILLSLFGDYIYYKFCVRRIKKIRERFDDGKAEGYYDELALRGTPSKLRAVIGILATLFVGQLVAVLPFNGLLG